MLVVFTMENERKGQKQHRKHKGFKRGAKETKETETKTKARPTGPDTDIDRQHLSDVMRFPS